MLRNLGIYKHTNTDGLSLPKRATEKHAGKTASSQPKTNTYREFHIKH